MIDRYTLERVYDQGISDWLNRWAILNGNIVPHVFASPRRAFSSMRDLLIKYGRLPADAVLDNVPLPFISFRRGNISLNLKYWSRAPFRLLGWTDASKRYGLRTRSPQPVLIPYEIEIWSKYTQSDATLTDNLQREFMSNMSYMTVRHFEPYGEKRAAIRQDNFVDNSELEGGTESEVTTRHTLSVVVEGLLFYEVNDASTALSIHTEKIDGTPEEPVNNLETIIVTCVT